MPQRDLQVLTKGACIDDDRGRGRVRIVEQRNRNDDLLLRRIETEVSGALQYIGVLDLYVHRKDGSRLARPHLLTMRCIEHHTTTQRRNTT